MIRNLLVRGWNCIKRLWQSEPRSTVRPNPYEVVGSRVTLRGLANHRAYVHGEMSLEEYRNADNSTVREPIYLCQLMPELFSEDQVSSLVPDERQDCGE